MKQYSIANCKNGYTKVIARLTSSAKAIPEVRMGLPRFARNDRQNRVVIYNDGLCFLRFCFMFCSSYSVFILRAEPNLNNLSKFRGPPYKSSTTPILNFGHLNLVRV